MVWLRTRRLLKFVYVVWLQTCIGRVVAAIEARSVHGFRCKIGREDMLCFARLGVMALDTPERVKYFGLRSKLCCAICRKRKGRSAFKENSSHSIRNISELYAVANGEAHTRPLISARKRARERLERHGFNPKKRCRLTDHAKHCLVKIASLGDRLFGGLVRYERMHVYFINYCTYLLDLLVKSVPKTGYLLVHHVVRQCHQFRDPWTGSTHPRLPNLLKMTHLTAERRVRAIFYWAHVLGLRAHILPAPIRQAGQRAVATLQLLLIAVRGHRAYTSGEWDVIFKGVGQQFFMALEVLAQFHEGKDFANRMVAHQRDPHRNRQPKHFRKIQRWDNMFVYVIIVCSYTLLLYVRIRHYCMFVYVIIVCSYTCYVLFVHVILFTSTSFTAGIPMPPIQTPRIQTEGVVVWASSSTA